MFHTMLIKTLTQFTQKCVQIHTERLEEKKGQGEGEGKRKRRRKRRRERGKKSRRERDLQSNP